MAANLPTESLANLLAERLVDEKVSAPPDGEKKAGTPTQWQIDSGAYCPVGATEKALPSGAYKHAYIRGQSALKPNPLQTDKLLEMLSSPVSRVLASIEDFWHRKEAFLRHGMIYKRGILLWGPPGGGKTAAIGMVCQRVIDRGGLVILCEAPSSAETVLQLVRQIEGGSRPIVNVIEDIERFFEKESHELPYLLSLLDGQTQVENIVHLATTNSPEVADDRVVKRPSRFDEVIEVGALSEVAREEYIRYHAGEELGEGVIDEWVRATDGLPIAFVKELVVSVLCLGRDFGETIERLKGMIKSPKGYGVKKNGSVGFPGPTEFKP